MKCKMNGNEVAMPCVASCPVFGDCVVEYQSTPKATKPTHGIGVAVHIFGGGVDHNVRPPLEGLAVDRCGEGVVHQQGYAILVGGGRPYPADICEAVKVDMVAELEEEVASREQSGIEEHNEVHYWKDRAKKSESELSALQSRHKEAVELVGFAIEQLEEDRHCKMCMNHFVLRGKCYGVSVCGQARPAWRWQHADRYEALKAKENE